MTDEIKDEMTEVPTPPTTDQFPGRPRTISDDAPTSPIPSAPSVQATSAPSATPTAAKRETDRATDRTARLEKAKADLKKAQARVQAMEARERTLHRKSDSRRKIIFGGLLIEAALQDPAWAERLAELQSRIVRERDLKTFEGWSLESERRND